MTISKTKFPLIKRWEKKVLNCLVVENSVEADAHKLIISRIKELRGVTSCIDATHALSILKYFHKHMDFVIIDYRVADMDFLQLIDRIKKSPATANLPIILLVEEGTEKEKITFKN